MTTFRLTETGLRNIIRESVRKALNEGVYDTDDSDNEIYDLEPTGRFRFTWWIRKSERMHKWEDVSEGQEEFQSEKEAIDAAKKVLTEAPKTAYAVKFNIERFIDTYADGRWEYIMNYNGCRVRDIIEGDEVTTSIYDRHPDVSESIARHLVREAVDDAMSSINPTDYVENDDYAEHRKQAHIRDIAKQALRKIGYTEITEFGNNPYILRINVDGFNDESRIERALRHALRPDSSYALSVKVDSDLMGVNYYCKVMLPAYTHCNINL